MAPGWLIEISYNHPSLVFRVRKTALNNLPNCARLGLPYNLRLLDIRIRCLEVAKKQREGFKFQLQAIATKERKIPKVLWQVCQPKIYSSQMRMAFDCHRFGLRKHGHIEATTIVAG